MAASDHKGLQEQGVQDGNLSRLLPFYFLFIYLFIFITENKNDKKKVHMSFFMYMYLFVWLSLNVSYFSLEVLLKDPISYSPCCKCTIRSFIEKIVGEESL